MRARLPSVVLLVCTLSVCLAAAEGAIRAFVTVRNVGPTFSEYDPVYGKSLRKNLAVERIAPEFHMRFTTNSLGFRGPEPDGFPAGGILFIGDSFTEGYGVTDGDEYPQLVGAALVDRLGAAAPPVVNAGIGDVGNGRFVKFLRREGRRLRPRVVVCQLTDNDFGDNVREGLFTLAPDGTLVEHAPTPAGALRVVQRTVEAIPGLAYSHTLGLVRQAFDGVATAEGRMLGDEPRASDPDLLTIRILETLFTICRDERWPVMVLTVEIDSERLTRIRDLAAPIGAAVVPLPSSVERPDFYYRIDGHWNPRGHEEVAGVVLQVLARMGLVAG